MSQTIDDCETLFRTLPPKTGLAFLRKAGRKAATLIRDEASSLAPKDTGQLSESMAIKTKKESNDTIEITIAPKPIAWYGRLVELGTTSMSPQPHLMPAVEAKGDDAAKLFAVELDNIIRKHFHG